jgi:cell division FtsZ-interacting protein ZapD
MKTLTLRVEDSAVEKLMWFLQHLADVVKIEDSPSLRSELLDDLEKYKSGALKTTQIESVEEHIMRLKCETVKD